MEKRIGRNKRSLLLLIFGMLCTFGLAYFISIYNPQSIFPAPFSSIKPIFLFFVLFFLSLSLLSTYVLKHRRRGILIGLFVCSYLLLRLNHLTEIYFALILLASFVSLELFFTKYH